MDTRQKLFRFIILIPHKDALKPLEEYRQKLFSMGVSGAHSFPLAAPLAEISRPLSSDELKELARNIRAMTKERDGKIQSRKAQYSTAQDRFLGTASAPGSGISFFGPVLDLPAENSFFPQTIKDKLISTLLPPVFCAAVVESREKFLSNNLSSEEAPVLSFRAASLANLAIRPLAGAEYSFEWKINPPVWLPAYK